MAVLKRFKISDLQPGDMLIREMPPLNWLILAVSFEDGRVFYTAIDANDRGAGPFEVAGPGSWEYPLHYKLLRQDE